MKNATLRQLKVFEAVARNLSFSRAAEELFLSQPAVSIQVKKLEDYVGLPLFEQLGKKIYLTPAGTEMLRCCRAIIQQFNESEESMNQFKGISGGRLSVSVISAGDYFFPGLLVEFLGRHAGVKLDFAVCNREELLARLADNRTDLAVMVRPPVGEDIANHAFAPHPYVILAAPAHPLAGKNGFRSRDSATSLLSCAKKAPTPGSRCKKDLVGNWPTSISAWKFEVLKPSSKRYRREWASVSCRLTPSAASCNPNVWWCWMFRDFH